MSTFNLQILSAASSFSPISIDNGTRVCLRELDAIMTAPYCSPSLSADRKAIGGYGMADDWQSTIK
jgi:hypothetical protein